MNAKIGGLKLPFILTISYEIGKLNQLKIDAFTNLDAHLGLPIFFINIKH